MQEYSSCKEGGIPRRIFIKNHINAILLFFCGLRVSGNKGPMLVTLYEAFQKAPDNLKAPKVTVYEADNNLTVETSLRRRITFSTGVPLRSKCTCNCYFKFPRTLSIDATILCINIIIIITTYELLNRTHSTRFYAYRTYLDRNPILALYLS